MSKGRAGDVSDVSRARRARDANVPAGVDKRAAQRRTADATGGATPTVSAEEAVARNVRGEKGGAPISGAGTAGLKLAAPGAGVSMRRGEEGAQGITLPQIGSAHERFSLGL